MNMQTQPTRFLAMQMTPSPTILKQVDQAHRKALFELGDKCNTIIIDYGSQTIKAGYQQSKQPQLVFRPYISRNRDPNKTDSPIKYVVNTSYDQIDFQKLAYKSAFERNIILHFSILQQCNDYIFSEIIRPNKHIRSPFIISQSLANPIHCRTSVIQQFFQCYEAQSLMIGVDALFAYFYQLQCNIHRYQKQSSLVIDIGANTIHIFAILDGKPQWGSVRRINLGGNNAFQLFAKTVMLKNPQLKQKLTYTFLKDIYQRFTKVAIDYRQQLTYFKKSFAQNKDNKVIYKNRIAEQNKHIEQKLIFFEEIQIDFETILQIPQEQRIRKQEIKQRMSEKLRETINRRKQMKKRILEKQLKDLQFLRDKYDEHDKSAHEEVAQLFGEHHPYDKLLKKIKALSIKLGLVEQKPQEKKFHLIDIPDNQLPPEKLKFKKMQIYQKKAMQERQRRKRQKIQQEQQMKQLRQQNPEEYLAQLRNKYQALSKKVKQNERIKNQLNNRKSKLKQKKMQVLIKLAQEDLEDNFGENDDDWLIYKDVEQSDHYSEIQAMQTQLRQIDPQWIQTKRDIHHLNSNNQLFLTTEIVKCNEMFFQPKIIGLNQSGIIQTITSIMNLFSVNDVKKLLKNIVVIGGSCQIEGLSERIYRDLRRQCPVDVDININISKVGWKGAYLGMKSIAKNHAELISKMSYQKHQYIEKGQKFYFVQNPWSNPRPQF